MDRRHLGRSNPVVISQWSDAKVAALWERNRHMATVLSNSAESAPFSPCMMWQGSTQNGYPALSQGHGKSKIKMHIVACRMAQGRVPQRNEVCSHLCHRKRCISPDHLVIEPIGRNHSRTGCFAAFKSPSGQVWMVCCHLPRCLRSDTEGNHGRQPYLLSKPVINKGMPPTA